MSDLQDIQAAQAEIISEFGIFDDWIGRYEHLIGEVRSASDAVLDMMVGMFRK